MLYESIYVSMQKVEQWQDLQALCHWKRILLIKVNSVLKSLLAAHTQNAAVKKLRICQTNLPGIINHNIFLGIFLQEYATSTFPIMHLICPPKFCITFVFHFSWVLQPSQEKLKTMFMQNFGGQITCIMGNVEVAYSIEIWKHWFTFFQVLVNVHPCRPVQQRTGNSSNAYIQS